MIKAFPSIFFIFILFFKLILILIIINNGGILVPDSQSYLEFSKNFFFNQDNNSFTRGDLPFSSRTLIYPFFLHLNYLFTHNSNFYFIIFSQFIFSLLSCYLTYKICKIIFNKKYAILAAFIYLFDVGTTVFIAKISTEIIFVFILLLTIYFFLCFIKREKSIKKIKYLLLTCFFLIIIPHIRPIGLYLPIIFFVFIFLIIFLSKIYYKSLLILITILFVFFHFFFIHYWKLHNLNHFGVYEFSNVSLTNIVDYNLTHIYMIKDKIDLKNARIKARDNFVIKSKTNTHLYRIDFSKVRNFIIENPIAFSKTIRNNIIVLFLDPGDGIFIRNIFDINYSGKSLDLRNMTLKEFIYKWYLNFDKILLSFIISFLTLFILFKVFFSIFGILYTLKNFNISIFFMFFILIYFVFLSAGLQTNARFRIPIEPFLSILFSLGLLNTINIFKNNKN